MRQDIQRRARGKIGIRDTVPNLTGSRDTQYRDYRQSQPSQRAHLYDEVTAKIIAELEAGRFPWVQPWGKPSASEGGLAPGLPRNAVTGAAIRV
jgi:hypothetical protein